MDRIELTNSEEDTAVVFVREDGKQTWKMISFENWTSTRKRKETSRKTDLMDFEVADRVSLFIKEGSR